MTPAHRGGPQITCISGPPHLVIHASATNPRPRQMPGTGKTPVSNAFAAIIAEGILGNAWLWSSTAHAVTIGRCRALEQPLHHQCLWRLQRQQRELRPRRRQGRLQQAVGSAHARRRQPNRGGALGEQHPGSPALFYITTWIKSRSFTSQSPSAKFERMQIVRPRKSARNAQQPSFGANLPIRASYRLKNLTAQRPSTSKNVIYLNP